MTAGQWEQEMGDRIDDLSKSKMLPISRRR